MQPVLAKTGCNAGACHGNKNGKGGFKISLRGQDPSLDYEALTRDLFARRGRDVHSEARLARVAPAGPVDVEVEILPRGVQGSALTVGGGAS